MAVWQVTVQCVRGLHKDQGKATGRITIVKSSLDKLESVLGLHESWSKDIVQYGTIDSTCIEILYEEKQVEEVSIRFDLRNVSLSELDAILSFINTNNLEILFDGKVFPPSMQNLETIFYSSSAYKYISNPENYLSKLKH